MGIETTVLMAAISAGATIAKIGAEKEAEQANLSAINVQSKVNNLQYQQKTLQNLDMIEKMLSKQAAQLSTRGVAFDSPSFNAIQRDTVNAGGKKQNNLDTEKSLSDQALDIERKNVKNTFHAQLFGDVANFAFGAVDLNSKVPTKGSLPRAEDL
jgi:hypothetical protein